MVCVDRIIIATTCFGDSSVNNNGGREALLTTDAVNENSNVEIINSRKPHEENFSSKSSSGGDGGEGSSKVSVRECRICQEEDEETDMEAPCACNGTLKVPPYPPSPTQKKKSTHLFFFLSFEKLSFLSFDCLLKFELVFGGVFFFFLKFFE